VILEGRKLYLKMTNPERIATFEKIVEKKIVEHYEAWNLENETAVALLVFEENIV
jgi:hypothetical protein